MPGRQETRRGEAPARPRYRKSSRPQTRWLPVPGPNHGRPANRGCRLCFQDERHTLRPGKRLLEIFQQSGHAGDRRIKKREIQHEGHDIRHGKLVLPGKQSAEQHHQDGAGGREEFHGRGETPRWPAGHAAWRAPAGNSSQTRASFPSPPGRRTGSRADRRDCPAAWRSARPWSAATP